jgi:hypothetical protein
MSFSQMWDQERSENVLKIFIPEDCLKGEEFY